MENNRQRGRSADGPRDNQLKYFGLCQMCFKRPASTRYTCGHYDICYGCADKNSECKDCCHQQNPMMSPIKDPFEGCSPAGWPVLTSPVPSYPFDMIFPGTWTPVVRRVTSNATGRGPVMPPPPLLPNETVRTHRGPMAPSEYQTATEEINYERSLLPGPPPLESNYPALSSTFLPSRFGVTHQVQNPHSGNPSRSPPPAEYEQFPKQGGSRTPFYNWNMK